MRLVFAIHLGCFPRQIVRFLRQAFQIKGDFGLADDIENAAWWKFFVIQFSSLSNSDQRQLVNRIVNDEIGTIAQGNLWRRILTQAAWKVLTQSQRDTAHQGLQSFFHLSGRLVRKGDGQNALGSTAFLPANKQSGALIPWFSAPAPARTNTGPSLTVTTSFCEGLSLPTLPNYSLLRNIPSRLILSQKMPLQHFSSILCSFG